MAFFEDRFPPCVSANMVGGPRFLTDKSYMVGGQRITNRLAQYPLQEFSLAHPIKPEEEFEDLRAFFYVVGGDADGFRFKDWSDFEATQQNTSTTLVTGSTYQLNRKYVFGSRTFTRPIQKPVAGLQVFRTRSAVVTNITGSTTINLLTGRIIVTGHASGDVYTWSGEFDVPVAFKDPSAAFRVLGGPRMLTDWPTIEVEEIRL